MSDELIDQYYFKHIPIFYINYTISLELLMLFVSNPPVKIQVENDRRIIVLTQSKIMFTHLDFI